MTSDGGRLSFPAEIFNLESSCGESREENARLREENAEEAAEMERPHADLAVLQLCSSGLVAFA
jgi:hypothetical protein